MFVFPTSSGQRRLWLLDQLIPGSPAYNLGWRVTLTGPLDPGRLTEALRAVVGRHEALRTTFAATDGVPTQVVTPRTHVPLVAIEPSEVDALVREPFDLAGGPLLRAGLVRHSAEAHELILVVHHAVVDGWSCAILFDELARCYGRTPLPEPPLQYPDYAVWQREQAEANSFAGAARYWTEALAGIPTVLPLPTDRPHTAARGRGAELVTDLEPAPGASFGELLAVFQAVLHRLSGQAEFLVATPVSARTRPETEHLVGFLANTLALPARITPETTFAQLADATQGAVEDALAHQELPFEQLVDLLAPQRSMAHAPLVQTMFSVEPKPAPATVDGVTFAPELLGNGGSKFDLFLTVEPGADRWRARWNYDTDLFDEATVAGFAEIYAVALRAARTGRDRPVAELPLTTATPPVTAVRPGGAIQVDLRRFGDAPAVAGPDGTRTYAELDAEANRLAHLLRANGVGQDVPVALCLARGTRVPLAVLATWRAGGGYLPLDPSWPVDRLTTMASDAGAPVLVTHAAAAVELPGDWTVIDLDTVDLSAQPDTPPEVEVPPTALAYLLYTSGSTGRPKGVAVTRGGVANLLGAMDELLDLSPADRLASITTPSFDVSVVEMFAPLLRGASVTFVAADEVADGHRLRERITDATVVQGTPSAWRMIVAAGGVPAGVRLRVTGGEALTRDLADALLADDAVLIDGYGPTETTVYSAAGRVPPAPYPIRLGPAVGGSTLHVLDPNLAQVPDGVIGELHIGGAGVARGYRNLPALTAEKFRPDPFSATPGARLYATGDLVRRRGGGLEFLGRADHQVKVRGFRIELGEVEAALRAHDSVRDAVVTTWSAGDADVRLVAYLVPRRRVGTAELRPWLARRLPDYMHPSRYVMLDALPTTPTGKVDRAALPEPVWTRERTHTVAPRTDTERRLATIWREVLSLGPDTPLGVHDDFFALGGHSLTATQLIARIRGGMAVDLPLAALFTAPTIAGLAESVAAGRTGRADGPRTLLDQLDELSDAEVDRLLTTLIEDGEL
ncbi:amino acid adenylation domain-containing protein [Actinophytocola gossypii]|uniref:Amino acid adenylation domain-containing protein n=1 Tax=Actinophytocola gossypii TaxID=2812003 RepID=A0ABT2J4R9_9PSEU|nr:amino acid adenylation domain-containing protein [Actinophytocola gossypii]MCT2582862.1 amino acid adenylation domain-containing protein [Actinophytocola gossypii]